MRFLMLNLIGGVAALALSGNASAINVEIDYTFDTTNFFGAGNPDGAVAGQQARDALEAAADYFSGITNDSFTGISTPPVFNSQVFNGQVVWQWSASFTNPTTGAPASLTDPTILADQYLVYAGARSLSGNTLGVGGPGGFGWSSSPSGGFTSGEITQINQITDDFSSDVETRGQASGFSAWGGAITFDNDGSSAWSFNHLLPAAGGVNDFFSVAIHELSHALGFGTSSEWNALVSGSVFTGAASTTEFGSNPPVSGGHWQNGTNSTVFGTTTSQEAAMDPSITNGNRKLFTTLDAAGLTDIGWDLTPPVTTLIGDLDGDGFVGITDLNLILGSWNATVLPGDPADPSGDNFIGIEDLNVVLGNWNAGTPPPPGTVVPEPMTLTLIGLAVPALMRRHRVN